jgi:serine/threonine protein kinase
MVGKMTEQEAWKLIRDTASALAYLHEMTPPIIHQDIKPDNILINDDGSYMLTDFGVSTQIKASLSRVSNQDMSLASAGTISYMAPERFSRSNTPIMANDIYSLGSTVYEMVTGYLPFGNEGGLLQKRGAEIPELGEGFSPLLQKTLDDCLQAEPWDRPVAKELEEIAIQALKGETSADVAVNATYRNSLGRSLGGSVGGSVGNSMSNSVGGPVGNSLGNSAGLGASAPQQATAKSKMPLLIGIGVVCALLIAGLVYFLSSSKSESAKEEITTEQADSIKAVEDYFAALNLLKSTNTDSVASGFAKMTGLAADGNKDAIFQIAYTYAWIPKDLESNRRKQALNWTIDKSTGRLASDDLNKEAVRWLNKSIEVTQGNDYKSLYWLSFYYYYGWGVKEDMNQVNQLLQQSRDKAEESGDLEFMNKVQDTINQFKE